MSGMFAPLRAGSIFGPAALLLVLAFVDCGPRPAAPEPDIPLPNLPAKAGAPVKERFSPERFARFVQLQPPAVDAKRLNDHWVVFVNVAPETDDATLEKQLGLLVARTVERFRFDGLDVRWIDIGVQSRRGDQNAYQVWLMPVDALQRYSAGAIRFEALVELFDFRQRP